MRSLVKTAFMTTVKQGVKNPYALAAIAATGKHESEWDPRKLTATWKDTSETARRIPRAQDARAHGAIASPGLRRCQPARGIRRLRTRVGIWHCVN
jgi:hypothetical protein